MYETHFGDRGCRAGRAFRCFDCSPRLSVGSGCELESARAHKNFDIVFDFGWQPAQIHIRVQLRLTGTSLCQCCRLPVKFQVPLAALIMHPHFAEQHGHLAFQVPLAALLSRPDPVNGADIRLTKTLFFFKIRPIEKQY